MVVKEMIGQSCYFGGYFYLRNKIGSFLAGLSAGLLYWSLIFPLDTMKTRRMLD